LSELRDDELEALLDKLDSVCRQARELQEQIKAKMAESARGDRLHPGSSERDRRQAPRK